MRSGRSLWLLPAQLSLLANVVILISVALDAEWVRTRAAGGQFDEFPTAIRIIYLVMALGTLYLMRFLFTLYRAAGSATERQLKVAKWLGFIFIVSTFTQLISRSADERWNAIPAAIIAFAFLKASSVGKNGSNAVRS